MAIHTGGRGPGHTARVFGGSGPTISTAAISRFEFLSPTGIDPQVAPDNGQTYSVTPRGNLVEIETDTISGATFDPTKITFVMRNPGFINGVAGYRYTAFTVKAVIRKQVTSYTDPFVPNVRTSGGKTIWVCAVQYDPIGTILLETQGNAVCRYVGYAYSGSEFVSVSAADDWYTNGITSAASGEVSLANCANNSTRAYREPEVHPLNFEREHETSTTRTIRYVVRHRYGQHGRQFDTSRVRARDASGNYTPWVSVNEHTARATPGGVYVEECQGAISLTGLTQGELCRDEIEVFPLIGTTSYVSTAHESDPADPRYPQQFLCDRTGALASHVVVDAVAADGTKAAQTTISAADATKFGPTEIVSAVAALATLKGNIGCGHVYLRNTTGSPVSFAIGANITAAIGEGAWYLQAHPDNNAEVRITLEVSTTRTVPQRLICEDVTWIRPTINASIGTGQASASPDYAVIGFRRCKVDLAYTDAAGSSPWIGTGWARGYWEDITYEANGTQVPGHLTPALGSTGTNRYIAKVVNGFWNNTASGSATLVPYTVLGFVGKGNPTSNRGSGQPSCEGMIVAHSFFRKQTGTSHSYGNGTLQDLYVRGGFVDNIVIEWATTNQAMTAGGDGQVRQIENFIIYNLYQPGDPTDPTNSNDIARLNRAYNDVAASRGVEKEVPMQLSAMTQFACKTDTFNNPEGYTVGRVANWQTYTNAEDYGTVMMINRDPEATSGGDNNEWAGMFRSVNSKYNTGVPETKGVSKVGQTAGGGAALADYRPSGASNPLQNMVQSGHHKTKYDLLGNLRVDDGTDCAGPLMWVA